MQMFHRDCSSWSYSHPQLFHSCGEMVRFMEQLPPQKRADGVIIIQLGGFVIGGASDVNFLGRGRRLGCVSPGSVHSRLEGGKTFSG